MPKIIIILSIKLNINAAMPRGPAVYAYNSAEIITIQRMDNNRDQICPNMIENLFCLFLRSLLGLLLYFA